MSYDVAEYSDYEYEKHVYGYEPTDGQMDDLYGPGQWTNYDTSLEDADEHPRGLHR